MTHAELYDIVKDHRDVWGEVLEYAETNSPNPPLWIMKSNEELFLDDADIEGEDWKRESVALDDRIMDGGCPISTEGVIVALLGLGVEWLVENGGSARIYPPLPTRPEYFVGTDDCGGWRLPSLLASVYAAIAEVKKAKA